MVHAFIIAVGAAAAAAADALLWKPPACVSRLRFRIQMSVGSTLPVYKCVFSIVKKARSVLLLCSICLSGLSAAALAGHYTVQPFVLFSLHRFLNPMCIVAQLPPRRRRERSNLWGASSLWPVTGSSALPLCFCRQAISQNHRRQENGKWSLMPPRDTIVCTSDTKMGTERRLELGPATKQNFTYAETIKTCNNCRGSVTLQHNK